MSINMPISRREWVLASLCWSELLRAQMLHGQPRLTVLSAADASEVRALTNAYGAGLFRQSGIGLEVDGA